jgi:hypothetical protein
VTIATDAALRRRAVRALHELLGHCETGGPLSEPMHPRDFYRTVSEAMDRYLGPSIGMSASERWRQTVGMELEILCEAMEERVGMVVFG